MLAEEAQEEARQALEENPEQAAELRSAAKQALDECKGTRFGSMDSFGSEGADVTDADFSIIVRIPLDAFFDMDWTESEVSVGSNGYGVTTNASLLWEDASVVGECLENQLDEAIDRVIEERDALLAGDYSTLRAALAAVAVDYAIDEAYKYNHDLGEILDTLAEICSRGNDACF